MALLAVERAIAQLLAGVAPTEAETVPIATAGGRVLAADLAAKRTQPPFPASAMDGYAVRAAEANAGAALRVIGESRAGQRFAGRLGPGEAVRIFTGAPVPEGADAILIQENAERAGERVIVHDAPAAGRFIRPAGLDFRAGEVLLTAGRLLDARAVALAAAMDHAEIPVRRRPRVAILSNGVALATLVRQFSGEPFDVGIAPDRIEAIAECAERASGSDVLVVIGGASVGDHDLVKEALAGLGMTLDFWRIAMRPGKPLMVGRLGAMQVLGLPGNPVSALVCGHVFLRPLIAALLGLDPRPPLATARLGVAMPGNDERQDYVRAELRREGGELIALPFPVQDSSMLATLAKADGLIVRPVRARPAAPGDQVPVLMF